MIDLRRFQAVIFDFDGVIADSEVLQCQAWTQAARDMGVGDLKVEIGQIAGRQDIHIGPELIPPPHDARDVQACMNRKCELERELEEKGLMQPMPGSIDLIGHLAPTHKLAIASSRFQHSIERWLLRRELRQNFCAIVGKEDGLACKPSPEPYLRVLRMLELDGANACAIEDSPTGITAAKAAGLFTIQLLHPYMAAVDAADLRVQTLGELLK